MKRDEGRGGLAFFGVALSDANRGFTAGQTGAERESYGFGS